MSGLLMAGGQTASAQLAADDSLEHYVHRNWQTAQGLPQNSVLASAQTPDGYLWFGTEEGLVRFDGVRFTVFDHNTSGLQVNMVLAILVDHLGRVWVGTAGGGVSRLQNGQFVSYTTKEGLPSNVVRALLEDRNGDIWIGTDGGGLARLRNDRLQTFTQSDGLADNSIFSLAKDNQGTIWIGTHHGLSRWVNGRLSTLTTRDGLSNDFVRAICVGADGAIWVGTNDGLSKITGAGMERFTTLNGLASNSIFALRTDRAGQIWAGTTSGLSRLRHGAFESFGEKDGLQGSNVWSIFEDREGGIWVGTAGGGLNYLRRGSFTTIGTKDGLVGAAVLAVYQDPQNGFWLGSDQGLTYLHDGVTTVYTKRDGLPDNLVFSVAQDATGTTWIGTRGGLAMLRDGKIKTVTEVPKGFVLCTMVDRRGYVWIGTRSGLTRYDGKKFRTYSTKDGLSSNTVVSIYQDFAGILWIGTSGGGLNRFDGERFQSFDARNGLAGDLIWAITGEPNGTLWIGTSGRGLSRFAGGKFTTYTAANGLFDDTVLSILDDRLGNLWFSSNKGVFKVSKRDLDAFADGRVETIRSVYFGAEDGMKSRECNGGFQPAGSRAQDGKLWFPTTDGVAIVDPGKLTGDGRIEALVEKVTADGRKGLPGSAITVPPGKGQLEFQFTAPTFIAPQKVQFRYMLEGFDKDWTEAGARRTAYYTNIPPGTYRFIVQAGSGGAWTNRQSSIGLTLEPHYWQTNTFYVLLIGAALSLCVVTYRVRVRQLKASGQRLAELVDERTAALVRSQSDLRQAYEQLELRVQERTSELRQSNQALEAEVTVRRETEEELILARDAAEAASRAKSEFLANMSHEIRTPINGIIGMTEITLGTNLEPEQREYLEIVQVSADSLLSIINDILDFSKIEARKLTLESTPFELRAAIHQLLRSLSLRARQKGLALQSAMDTEVPDRLVGDPLRLRQVLLNLLDNAIKFTSTGGISLSIRLVEVAGDSVFLRFSVKDTGIGISTEKQQAIFEAFSQADTSSTRRYGGTGLGLTISSQLAGMMGGRLWVESEPGQGSTFHLTARLQITTPLEWPASADSPAYAAPRELPVAL